jgi:hypothetical protein
MLSVTRVLAPNPGVYTLEGTNTWIVGRWPSVVIDPGPDDAGHLLAVMDEDLASLRGDNWDPLQPHELCRLAAAMPGEDHAGLVSMLRRNREYIEERLARDPRIPKGMPRTEQVG